MAATGVRAARVRANPGQGQRLREEILAAAERLLDAAGGDEVLTMRAVAQDIGVTTPSLYRHFPDKASLVSAVCLRVWHELGERMQAAALEHDDPFRALGASGRAYIRFGLAHPVQYRLLLLRPAPSGHSTAQEQAARACYREVVDAVRSCVEAGVLHGNPAAVALTLWATVHGCVSMLISSPPFPPPEDLDAFIDATMRTAGLGSILATWFPAADVPLVVASLTSHPDQLAEDLGAEGQSNRYPSDTRLTGHRAPPSTG